MTVEAIDDHIVESNHARSISHVLSSEDARFDGAAVAGVIVEITDNDPVTPLDAAFGNNGVVVTDFERGWDDFADIAVQPDGKIVAVGTTLSGADKDFAVVRYHSDGSLDTSFEGGRVGTDLGSSNDVARSVAIQPDGRIVVVGGSGQTNQAIAVTRYDPDGLLDTTFGSNGIVVSDLGLPSPSPAVGVAIHRDGKIVVAFTMLGNFAVAQFNPDGSLDSEFGMAGVAVADFGLECRAASVIAQPDGKVLVVGTVAVEEWTNDSALARFLPNGTWTAPWHRRHRLH